MNLNQYIKHLQSIVDDSGGQDGLLPVYLATPGSSIPHDAGLADVDYERITHRDGSIQLIDSENDEHDRWDPTGIVLYSV